MSGVSTSFKLKELISMLFQAGVKIEPKDERKMMGALNKIDTDSFPNNNDLLAEINERCNIPALEDYLHSLDDFEDFDDEESENLEEVVEEPVKAVEQVKEETKAKKAEQSKKADKTSTSAKSTKGKVVSEKSDDSSNTMQKNKTVDDGVTVNTSEDVSENTPVKEKEIVESVEAAVEKKSENAELYNRSKKLSEENYKSLLNECTDIFNVLKGGGQQSFYTNSFILACMDRIIEDIKKKDKDVIINDVAISTYGSILHAMFSSFVRDMKEQGNDEVLQMFYDVYEEKLAEKRSSGKKRR